MLHNATPATGLALGLDLPLDGTREADRLAAWTAAWHDETRPMDDAGGILLQIHRANFDLWHQEDLARSVDAPDAIIAGVKRTIDRLNQQRNDAVQAIDTALLQVLQDKTAPSPNAPLHSETPGMMLDRLSILSLKIFHTHEQTSRLTATEQHRARNANRLAVLEEQSRDLAECLTTLWADVLHGTRRIKLYQQMKMYNDPDLNPVLYNSSATGTAA